MQLSAQLHQLCHANKKWTLLINVRVVNSCVIKTYGRQVNLGGNTWFKSKKEKKNCEFM